MNQICRNSGRTISPINALPAEILAQIFQLVHSSASFATRSPDYWSAEEGHISKKRAIAPDALSQVCTRWRRVTLGMPELWTHIDLSNSSEQLLESLLARGQMFSHRASSWPLSLCFTVTSDLSTGLRHAGETIGEFNRVAARRLRSLELRTWTGLGGFEKFLESNMAVTTLGILEELIITNHTTGNCNLPCAARRSASLMARTVRPDRYLDSKLHAISRLTLEGVFFPWSSPAYKGLVELRILASKQLQIPIPHQQLSALLSASPGLRVFHFDLAIENFDSGSEIYPVHLEELEEVNIRQMPVWLASDYEKQELLLSLLTPGSKSLSLSMSISISGSYASHYGDMLPSEVHSFLERSNTTRLYITVIEHPHENFKLISFARILAELSARPMNLSVLGLDHSYDFIEDAKLVTTVQPCPVSIDTLVLHEGMFNMTSLQELIDACSIQKLVARGCSFRGMGNQNVYEELVKMAPVVKYSRGSPQKCCPIDEWAHCGHLDW